jgi:hypothetical protein
LRPASLVIGAVFSLLTLGIVAAGLWWTRRES